MAQKPTNTGESHNTTPAFNGKESTNLGASLSDLLGALKSGKKPTPEPTPEPEAPNPAPNPEPVAPAPGDDDNDPLARDVAIRAESRRLARAETETMYVDDREFSAPFAVRVHSGSGNAYVVNLRSGECSCPDHQEGSHTCKHYLRAVMELGVNPLNNAGRFGCAGCESGGFCLAHHA